jgi:hypothetical protein
MTESSSLGPDTKIAAAPFLGLGGSVDLGSLDQVVGVAAYKGCNRCPVLVCPNVKVDGWSKEHLLEILRKSVQVSQQGATLLRCA